MRISGLIALLKSKMVEHGDIKVLCLTSAYGEAEDAELTEELVGVGYLPSSDGQSDAEKVLTVGTQY